MSQKLKRLIFLMICVLVVFSLCKQRKYYEFSHKNEKELKEVFDTSQFQSLSTKNAIIDIAASNVIFIKSQSLVFTVFSKSNFNELKIKKIEIFYDNKHKTLKKKNVYEPDDHNKNMVSIKTYNVNNVEYTGFEKLIFPTFNTKDFCWVNFYNMFKWRHGKVNDKFPVKIICHYSLDDEDYTEELDYIVECKESYPSRLYKIFFNF